MVGSSIVNIRLEASCILNMVDVQKYYSLAAILLASCIRRWREHHEGPSSSQWWHNPPNQVFFPKGPQYWWLLPPQTTPSLFLPSPLPPEARSSLYFLQTLGGNRNSFKHVSQLFHLNTQSHCFLISSFSKCCSSLLFLFLLYCQYGAASAFCWTLLAPLQKKS